LRARIGLVKANTVTYQFFCIKSNFALLTI
jgi:hypothetical protein